MTTFVRRAAALVVPLAFLGTQAGLTPGADAASLVNRPATAAACQRTLDHYPVLHPGDRRAAVRTLQCTLDDLGLGPVAVDGFYGPQDRRAVFKVVSTFEALPDHPYRINNGMWTLLFARQLPHRSFAEGDHGHAVVVLQRALRAAGGRVTVDGHYGPQTAAVVAAYQSANHAQPTGMIDDETIFLLTQGAVFGHQN